MTLKKNKISIITLTYNKLEEATKPYIDYLYRGMSDFELIIVDNGSTDGTVEYLRQLEQKHNNVGFVSPCSMDASLYSRKKFERKVKKNQKELSGELFINPDFSCVFVKKHVFDKIGLFDENFYPAYFEDDDIAWRAIFAGFKNFKIKNVYFYHLGSITGKSLTDLNKVFERNKKYFFEKYSDKPFVECYWKLASKCGKQRRNLLLRLLLKFL